MMGLLAWAWLFTLPGPSGPIRVIAPPGAVGDARPTWRATTEIGHDPAGFADRP